MDKIEKYRKITERWAHLVKDKSIDPGVSKGHLPPPPGGAAEIAKPELGVEGRGIRSAFP